MYSTPVKNSSSSPFSSPSFSSPSASSSSSSSASSSSSSSSSFSFENRLRSFMTIDELLPKPDENQTSLKICKIIGKVPDKLILGGNDYLVKPFDENERGDNSNVFKIPGIDVAIKVMRKTPQNISEAENYLYIRNMILEKQAYNLPLIYNYYFCNACSYTDYRKEDTIKEVVRKKKKEIDMGMNIENTKTIECMVILSELFDGSLKNYYKDSLTITIGEMITILAQISMGCYVFEFNGFVHGDMNKGNVLYKSSSSQEDNEKYFYYVLPSPFSQDQYIHLYIKSYGKLWVLWDFNRFTNIGDTIPEDDIKAESVIKNDISRLLQDIGVVGNDYLSDILSNIGKEYINTIMDLIMYLYQSQPHNSNNIIISETERDDIDIIRF